MDLRQHAATTGSALKNWFIAQCCDAATVAALWWAGLTIIGIPGAPLWALMGRMLQFVPNFGGAIAMIFPALVGAFSANHMKLFYVLILYPVILLIEAFCLQPYFMKLTSRMPFCESLL